MGHLEGGRASSRGWWRQRQCAASSAQHGFVDTPSTPGASQKRFRGVSVKGRSSDLQTGRDCDLETWVPHVNVIALVVPGMFRSRTYKIGNNAHQIGNLWLVLCCLGSFWFSVYSLQWKLLSQMTACFSHRPLGSSSTISFEVP